MIKTGILTKTLNSLENIKVEKGSTVTQQLISSKTDRVQMYKYTSTEGLVVYGKGTHFISNKLTWHERFAIMKEKLELSNTDIAIAIDSNKTAVDTATRPSNKFPMWLKLAVAFSEGKFQNNI